MSRDLSLAAPHPSLLPLLVVVPLLAWRFYSRLRRLIGRQKLSKYRPWVTLTIFPLIVLLLGFAARAHPERLALLAVGLAAGAWLGVFGLEKTKFEATPEGLYYTPNVHLGIALSSLFFARIVYRFVEIYFLDPGLPRGLDDFARSWLTQSVFGLLAGYYMSYAVGLLRWRFKIGA